MAFVLTGLTNYVEEKRLPLYQRSQLNANFLKKTNTMTDVKGKTALNLISTDVVFQSGASCGFNASGDTKMTQRMLDPKPLKINMQWCHKDLLPYWTQYQVKVAAGLQQDIPFEEYITNEIADKTAIALEKMYFQGASGQTNQFEGIISLLNTASGSTHNVTAASGTSVYTFIKDVAKAIPVEVKEKDDAVILVSAQLFEDFIQELVTANLFHYNPNNDYQEYVLPGTNVKVLKVNGLNGASDDYEYAIGGRLNNLFYGFDGEGDEDKYDIWYSKDDRVVKLAAEFIAGAQVAYPDEIAVGKLALD